MVNTLPRGSIVDADGGADEDGQAANASASSQSSDAQAQAALANALSVVNLDELVVPVIFVAIVERVRVETPRDNGLPPLVTLTSVPRTAQIAALVTVETQLRIFAEYQDLSTKPLAEQAAFMREAVLGVWQESEPDMTLDELSHCGLDLERLAALFMRLFTPASRR